MMKLIQPHKDAISEYDKGRELIYRPFAAHLNYTLLHKTLNHWNRNWIVWEELDHSKITSYANPNAVQQVSLYLAVSGSTERYAVVKSVTNQEDPRRIDNSIRAFERDRLNGLLAFNRAALKVAREEIGRCDDVEFKMGMDKYAEYLRSSISLLLR